MSKQLTLNGLPLIFNMPSTWNTYYIELKTIGKTEAELAQMYADTLKVVSVEHQEGQDDD